MHQRAIELIRVGFDLDGVLSRTELSVLAALKAARLIPTDTGPEQIVNFNYSVSFPSVSPAFVSALFKQGDVFQQAPCNPEAVNCLNILTDLGVETHIVTHRPWWKAREMTQEWLTGFGARYSHLHFVGDPYEKAAYCTQTGLDVFIEDKLETAHLLTQHVRLSMLYDRSYNQEVPEPGNGTVARTNRRMLRRFYRFDEVLRYFGICDY